MNGKWLWAILLALPLAIGGLVYTGAATGSDRPESESGYVCPLTGEDLPCPACCPLN